MGRTETLLKSIYAEEERPQRAEAIPLRGQRAAEGYFLNGSRFGSSGFRFRRTIGDRYTWSRIERREKKMMARRREHLEQARLAASQVVWRSEGPFTQD